MSQLGIPVDGSDDGVTLLQAGFNVDPLLQRQADCISTMTYNEYWQIIDAGVSRGRVGDLPLLRSGRGTLGRRDLGA
jgi:NitT/TauT family transport system substrate-binding protein